MKNDEMCGFWKFNFKMYDTNFTTVILNIKKWIVCKTMKCADFWRQISKYKEINCVKNDEMCGFLKLNFKILDKNFTIVILYLKKWLVWQTMKCADF